MPVQQGEQVIDSLSAAHLSVPMNRLRRLTLHDPSWERRTAAREADCVILGKKLNAASEGSHCKFVKVSAFVSLNVFASAKSMCIGVANQPTGNLKKNLFIPAIVLNCENLLKVRNGLY